MPPLKLTTRKTNPMKREFPNNQVQVTAMVHRTNSNSPIKIRKKTYGFQEDPDKIIQSKDQNDEDNHSTQPLTEEIEKRKMNYCSTSLQVAKYNSSISILISYSKSNMTLCKGPPLNAKVKTPNETYNDFFNNNIDFYKKQMVKHYTLSMPGSNIADTAAHTQDPNPLTHQLLVKAGTQQSGTFLGIANIRIGKT